MNQLNGDDTSPTRTRQVYWRLGRLTMPVVGVSSAFWQDNSVIHCILLSLITWWLLKCCCYGCWVFLRNFEVFFLFYPVFLSQLFSFVFRRLISVSSLPLLSQHENLGSTANSPKKYGRGSVFKRGLMHSQLKNVCWSMRACKFRNKALLLKF